MKTILTMALAAWLVVLMPLQSLAQGVTEDRVRELVRETLLNDPQILMDAIAVLEQRAAVAEQQSVATVLQEQRDLIERDPNAPVLANPEGDVTVVEFFDYNCPFCRRAMPVVEELIATDADVRVVYREWPILGEGSVFAARAALASREQGLYEEFHWAMMGMNGRAEEQTVLAIAADLGIDIDQLWTDMEAPAVDEHIETSIRLAEMLGITGTPTFIIGQELIPGIVPLEVMEDVIETLRLAAQ